MGSGTYLLLTEPEPQDEQRLRKAVRNERSFHPRGDDTADSKASGAQMRLFRRFFLEIHGPFGVTRLRTSSSKPKESRSWVLTTNAERRHRVDKKLLDRTCWVFEYLPIMP